VILRGATRTSGLVITLLALASGVVAPSTAHAESKLRVSPTIIELDGAAGSTLTELITVTAEDDPLTVELIHADFGFDDTSYQLALIRDDAPETTAFSTRGWFSLPKRRYVIRAGKSMDLPLRVQIPKNTPGGTYLGAALIRVVPPGAKGGASQVQAVPETGPLLFISVKGGDPPKARLARFDVPGRIKHGPVKPKLRIENDGDEFFTYEGSITLSGPGKDRKVKIPKKYVVPGEPRDVMPETKQSGDVKPIVLGDDKLGFGHYTVTTRLRIEPTGTTLVARRSVWIIPTWMRLVAVALVVLLAACIALLVKWWMDRRTLAAYEETRVEDAVDEDESSDDDETFVS
jgi:hypothetical protein